MKVEKQLFFTPFFPPRAIWPSHQTSQVQSLCYEVNHVKG